MILVVQMFCVFTVSVVNYTYLLPFPSGWTTSSTEAVHQLRPNAQPRHNQRLGKSVSSSYELKRMRNLHRILRAHKPHRHANVVPHRWGLITLILCYILTVVRSRCTDCSFLRQRKPPCTWLTLSVRIRCQT